MGFFLSGYGVEIVFLYGELVVSNPQKITKQQVLVQVWGFERGDEGTTS